MGSCGTLIASRITAGTFLDLSDTMITTEGSEETTGSSKDRASDVSSRRKQELSKAFDESQQASQAGPQSLMWSDQSSDEPSKVICQPNQKWATFLPSFTIWCSSVRVCNVSEHSPQCIFKRSLVSLYTPPKKITSFGAMVSA